MTLIFLPIWHFFALLNELENQYLHERKKTSNLFTTIDFDMKSLKTLRMISKAIRNTTASGFLSPQLLFFANNARMQVHISLTHIHFTLPNDYFYVAPFSVRKTQVYVCTNQCNFFLSNYISGSELLPWRLNLPGNSSVGKKETSTILTMCSHCYERLCRTMCFNTSHHFV